MNGIPKAVLILLLLMLFPVVGIGLVVSSWDRLAKARSAEDWPSVPGEIVSSELVEEKESIVGQRTTSGRHAMDVYSLRVRYVYEVDGTEYEGDRIAFEDAPTSDRHQVELTARQFGKGRTTVYYNPTAPQESLLAPSDRSGVFAGFVLGIALAVLPTGLIVFGLRFEFIDPPELPLMWRLAWVRVFGPKITEPTTDDSRVTLHDGGSEGTIDEQLDSRPPEEDFFESIVHWEPRKRIELVRRPPSILLYVVIAAVVGVVVAWFGMFPITQLVFGRDTPHAPELRTVAVTLFAVVGGATFVVMRIFDRGSHVIVDWQQGRVSSKQEFSRPRTELIRDTKSVLLKCVPVEGRRRRYRAAVAIRFDEDDLVVAQTCEARRKQDSAQEKGRQLADPLASGLGVSVELDGWEQ